MPVPVLIEYVDIVASFSFLLWDWVINIGDEIEYFWWGNGNWMKWFYFFLRYFPLMVEGSLVVLANSHPPMYICTRWHAYQAAAVVALTSAVELVLVVRIYALFNRRKIIIIPILVLWLIETTGMVISMVFAVPRMQFFGPCMIAYATPVLMGYWMSALAFESILFCLTIIRFLQFTPFHRKQGTLLYVFIQDGTWVFIVTFILMLINGIAIHTHLHTHLHAPLSGVCYQWAVSGFSCAGSTMLLNLRRFAHHHTNPDSTSDFANATHPPRCAQQPYGFLTTQFDVCQVPPAVEVKVKLKLPRVREGSEGTAETT